MITETSPEWCALQECMAHHWSFALYRQPGTKCRCVRDTGTHTHIFSDIDQLARCRGFVIAPFQTDGHHPIVVIETDEPADFECLSVSVTETDTSVSHSSPTPAYEESFGRFTTALRDGQFEKLVLSRPLHIPLSGDFSIRNAFETACTRYTRSCVYLFYTPQSGLWLGASPEILLAGDSRGYRTIALAGTQPLVDGRLPVIWNAKNRMEQQFVTTYLQQTLAPLGIHPEEKGPYPVQAGAISHLKTELSFRLPASVSVPRLLKALHPTPAVCGLPKQEAQTFIQRYEGYNRGYYSGFLGWLDPEGHTDIYVNLRCMHIRDNACTLYAGGGLLPSSTLEEEWQETERKLQTMRYVVQAGLRITGPDIR